MSETRWHYTQNGAQQTPVTEVELRQLAAVGRLRPKHPQKHGLGRAIFGLIMGILGSIVLIISVGAAMMHH